MVLRLTDDELERALDNETEQVEEEKDAAKAAKNGAYEDDEDS